jgi:hypothetical protein
MGLGGGPLGAIIGRYPSAAAGEDDLGGGGGGGGGGGAAGAGIISHNRRCRDVTFLVAFAAFWVAMIVNSSFGFNQGNPLRSDSDFSGLLLIVSFPFPKRSSLGGSRSYQYSPADLVVASYGLLLLLVYVANA